MNEYPQALWVCVIVGDFVGLWVVARCCFQLCHQTVARLPLAGATLLRGWLRAWPDLSVPAAAAGLLLASAGVLQWLLRLGCLRWCVSGTTLTRRLVFCAWARFFLGRFGGFVGFWVCDLWIYRLLCVWLCRFVCLWVALWLCGFIFLRCSFHLLSQICYRSFSPFEMRQAIPQRPTCTSCDFETICSFSKHFLCIFFRHSPIALCLHSSFTSINYASITFDTINGHIIRISFAGT